MGAAEDQSAHSILAQIDRVLASPHFSRSPTLSRLLRFVVKLTLDGKEQELKEYRLGVEVFERGADFDPRIDPIVRMQAAKLRARLAEYYASDGRDDTVLIAIPKGGYVPSFTVTVKRVSPPATHEVQSIAVLPFVSMSGDPENEYFSDGLTEELINVLTYVPGLRVVARTSVFSFKNTNKDVREIGAQLNVQTVLEGSVRKAGNQLRVTAQLIDVATGYHLLSRTFPRELKDVFAVQEELAGAVLTEIMPQVKPEARRPVQSYTPDVEVYNLYLKGMYALAGRFTGPQDCIELFRQAIDRDPLYAPVWAGLSFAYCFQVWYEMIPSKVGMAFARNAAQKAIELDDKQGLGYATLGMTHSVMDWNWREAERCYQTAVAVQPGLAIAHQFYAYTCLMPLHRFKDAIGATERALRLNPFDAMLCAAATMIYASTGDYAAAYRQHALGKESHPNHPLVYGGLGTAYEMEGRLQEALGAYRNAIEFSRRAHYPLSGLGHALAKSGDSAGARELLAEMAAAHPRGYCMSLVHLGLGETDEAIRWFEMAMDEREPHCLLAAFDPRFAPLRKDASFRELMGAMGLTQVVTA